MDSSPPLRVLVIDDEEDNADLIAELLCQRGLEARAAYDGPSAVEIDREFHSEVAIVDLGLPEMDGYELARRLREMSSTIRLIALTGHSYSEVRDRLDAVGFDDHLIKPVRIEDVESTILRLHPA